MEDLPYTVEFSWEGSGTGRTCIARALDENGTVIDSVSVGVTAHGIELPEYNRQRGHLSDIDIQNIAREELHKKLKDRDAKFGG
jgi:hypothetical protein